MDSRTGWSSSTIEINEPMVNTASGARQPTPRGRPPATTAPACRLFSVRVQCPSRNTKAHKLWFMLWFLSGEGKRLFKPVDLCLRLSFKRLRRTCEMGVLDPEYKRRLTQYLPIWSSATTRRFEPRLSVCWDRSASALGYLRPFSNFSSPNYRTAPAEDRPFRIIARL